MWINCFRYGTSSASNARAVAWPSTCERTKVSTNSHTVRRKLVHPHCSSLTTTASWVRGAASVVHTACPGDSFSSSSSPPLVGIARIFQAPGGPAAASDVVAAARIYIPIAYARVDTIDMESRIQCASTTTTKCLSFPLFRVIAQRRNSYASPVPAIKHVIVKEIRGN